MVRTEAQLRAQRKYREKNKQLLREKAKEYFQNNKEHIVEKRKEYMKEYRHSEQNIKYMKEYNQTPQGKKSSKITKWKQYGLIHENYDELYEYYLNCKNCEKCNIELTIDKINTITTKCMDHSHITGEFRNILCLTCNVKRREDNF